MKHWELTFMMELIHVDAAEPHKAMADCDALVQYAQKQNVPELMALFSILRAHIAFSAKDETSALASLKLAKLSIERLTADNANYLLLQLYYSVVHIAVHFYYSRTTLASQQLTQCHAMLEDPAHASLNVFQVTLSPGDVFSVDWLSKQELVGYVYYLSGMVMTSETTMKSSKRFTLEGLKHVEGALLMNI